MHWVNIHLTVLLSALVLADRADAHNGDHTAYAIPISGITIDGRLDDWPERMAVYPIAWVSPSYYKAEPPEGPHDLTASFRVGYDPSEGVLCARSGNRCSHRFRRRSCRRRRKV